MLGANGGTRTPDRRITNPKHYQLCYVGVEPPEKKSLDECVGSTIVSNRLGEVWLDRVSSMRQALENMEMTQFSAGGQSSRRLKKQASLQ